MVCKSRGLPEIIWNSHNVRETSHPLSRVTCPTILSNMCSYCNRIGHLLSGCPNKKYDNKVVEKDKSINMVDTLNYESDSEDEREMKEGHLSYNTLDKIRFKNRSRKWSDMMDSDSECDSVK